MAIDYLAHFENAAELCDEFEKHVEYVFFRGGTEKEGSIHNFCWSKAYQKYLSPIKACVQLCRLLKLQCFGDYESTFYEAASSIEIPTKTQKLEDLKFYLHIIRLGFKTAGNEMLAFCSAFDEEEKERMNEAIHNHLEDCNYSCVAMSVSAVESRLLKLMCLVSPDSERELEKKTLGQLIFEYVENKGKYKNIVPEKHEPLLQLCNTYRTFSVHPKKQKIKPTIASSILNLAIEFLTDQDTKPEIAKAQLIVSEGSK